MKTFIYLFVLTASATASVTYMLPGNTESEGWDAFNSTNYGSPSGFPSYPTASAPWPHAITPNVAGSAQSASFNKVSGGGYFASSSLYDTGLGGIYQITDNSPLSSLANIILQIDAGTAISIPPTLSYNGGNQSLTANYFTLVDGDYLSGFGGPPSPTLNHIWQWDTTGLGITSYEISWGSADNDHLTQYELTLDTSDQFVQVVPEPSVVLLVSLIPFAACLRRRRPAK
jgi:hypothetical protein